MDTYQPYIVRKVIVAGSNEERFVIRYGDPRQSRKPLIVNEPPMTEIELRAKLKKMGESPVKIEKIVSEAKKQTPEKIERVGGDPTHDETR